MNWGVQESESTQPAVSAALIPKRYNVQDFWNYPRRGRIEKRYSREGNQAAAQTIAISR